MYGRTLHEEKVRLVQNGYNARIEAISQRANDFLNSIIEGNGFSVIQENPLSRQLAPSYASEMLADRLKDEGEDTHSVMQEELVRLNASTQLELERRSYEKSKTFGKKKRTELDVLRSENSGLHRKIMENEEKTKLDLGNSNSTEELKRKAKNERDKRLDLEASNEKIHEKYTNAVELCDQQEDKIRLLKRKHLEQEEKLNEFLDEQRTLVEKHREMVVSLKEQVESIEKEANITNKDLIESHKKEISAVEEHYRSIIDQKVSEMQREVKHLSKQHEHALNNTMDEFTKTHIKKIDHNNILKELETQHLQEKAIFESQIDNIQTMLNSAKSDNLKLEGLSETYQQSHGEIKDEIQKKSQLVKELESQKEEILFQLKTAGNALEELKSSHRTEKEEKEGFLIENNQLRFRLQDTEEHSEHLEGLIKSLKAKYNEELDTLISYTSTEKEENAKLETELTKRSEIIQELEEKLLPLENELSEKQATVLALKQQITHLEEQASLQESKAREEASSSQQTQETYSYKLRNLQNQIQDLETELEGKNKELANLKENELRKSLNIETSKEHLLVKNIGGKLRSKTHGLRMSLLSLKESYQHISFTYRASLQSLSQNVSLKLLSLSASQDQSSPQPKSIIQQLEQTLTENAELRKYLITSPDQESIPSQHNKVTHLKHRITDLKRKLNGYRETKNKVKTIKRKDTEQLEKIQSEYREKIGVLKESLREKEESQLELRDDLKNTKRRMGELQKTFIAELSMIEQRIKELELQAHEKELKE